MPETPPTDPSTLRVDRYWKHGEPRVRVSSPDAPGVRGHADTEYEALQDFADQLVLRLYALAGGLK